MTEDNNQQTARLFILQRLEDVYEKATVFTEEIVTSEQLLSLLQTGWPEALPFPSIAQLNALMLEWGYEGNQIAATNEKLWKVTLKA